MHTTMEHAFTKAGITARDARLEMALAEYLNHGGTIARAMEIVQRAAERMGSEGQRAVASDGQTPNANAPQQTDDGKGQRWSAAEVNRRLPNPSSTERSEGHILGADKAVIDLPIAAPNHSAGHTRSADKAKPVVPAAMTLRDTDGRATPADKVSLVVPSRVSTERNGADQAWSADKACSRVPRPVSPQRLAAIKDSRIAVAQTILDTFKVLDGRAIGDIPMGQIEIVEAKNLVEGRLMELIREHAPYAAPNRRIRDVVMPSDMMVLLNRARGRNDH